MTEPYDSWTPEEHADHRAAMNMMAMQQAIGDLLNMMGDKYGYAVVYRDAKYLRVIHSEIGALVALLNQHDKLQAVS